MRVFRAVWLAQSGWAYLWQGGNITEYSQATGASRKSTAASGFMDRKAFVGRSCRCPCEPTEPVAEHIYVPSEALLRMFLDLENNKTAQILPPCGVGSLKTNCAKDHWRCRLMWNFRPFNLPRTAQCSTTPLSANA